MLIFKIGDATSTQIYFSILAHALKWESRFALWKLEKALEPCVILKGGGEYFEGDHIDVS